MRKKIDRLFNYATGLLFAFVCMQAPLFILEYRHQLIGHVNELAFQIKYLEKAAAKSGKTLELYIQKFLGSGDRDFAQQGEIMTEIVARHEKLSLALSALEHSPIWLQPWNLIKYLDQEIAYSVFQAYEPALYLSYEGVIYSLIGLIIGFSLYWMIKVISFGLFIKKYSKA